MTKLRITQGQAEQIYNERGLELLEPFQETLEHRQYIDKLKEEYCHNNNIGFIAIPYWDIVNKHTLKRYKIMIDNITS